MVMDGRINYLIILLLEDVPRDTMSPELRAYLTTHTYIDARDYQNKIDLVRKHLRFSMPKIPIHALKTYHKRVNHSTIDNMLAVPS